MSRNKIDEASLEDCSWAFLDNARITGALHKAAAGMARGNPELENDLYTEFALYLAVRPEKQDLPTDYIVRNAKRSVRKFLSDYERDLPIGNMEYFLSGEETE